MKTVLFASQKNGRNAVFSSFVYIPGGNNEDKIPPEFSGGLQSPIVSPNSFTVTWPAATDASGIMGYEISINGGIHYTPIGDVLAYTAGNLTQDTQYDVRVRAQDNAGNISAPLALTVRTTSIPQVYGVSITPSTTVIQGLGKQKFYAIVEGLNNPSQEVTWEVSLGAIDVNGEVTAPEAINQVQTGIVKAISKAFPEKFGTATFTIPMKTVNPGTPANPGEIMLTASRTLRTEAGNYYKRDGVYVPGDTFYLSQGVWIIDKDVDDSLYYALDVEPDLTAVNTTIKSVTAIHKGVTLDYGPIIKDYQIIVKVSGGDVGTSMDTINSITFRITCNNGEVFDRSFFFGMKEH